MHQRPFFVSTTLSIPTNFTMHFCVNMVSRSLARCFFVANGAGISALCCTPRSLPSFVITHSMSWWQLFTVCFTYSIFTITALGIRLVVNDLDLAVRDIFNIAHFFNLHCGAFLFPTMFGAGVFLLLWGMLTSMGALIAAIRVFVTDYPSFPFRILWWLGSPWTRACLGRMPCFRAGKGLCCYCSLAWRLPNVALIWHGEVDLFRGKQMLVCFEARLQTMLCYTHTILPANTLYSSSYWFCPM